MNTQRIIMYADKANKTEAQELLCYVLNTSEVYFRYIKPTIIALARHEKRGKYDEERALIAWKRVADACAKEYAKSYGTEGWNFGLEERCLVAATLEEIERENVLWHANRKGE